MTATRVPTPIAAWLTLGVALLALAIWPDALFDAGRWLTRQLDPVIWVGFAVLCAGVALAVRLARTRARLAAAIGVAALLAPLVALLGQTTIADEPAPNCARPYDAGLGLEVNAGFDPGHTGRAIGAVDTPVLAWQSPPFHEHWSVDSPTLVTDEDGVYLLRGAFTTRLDRATGAVHWYFYTDPPFAPVFTPALTTRQVLTLDGFRLTALDPASGNPRWVAGDALVSYASSPVVAGAVFAGDADLTFTDQLHAFDLEDGRRCWSTEPNQPSLAGDWTPSVAEGTVYAMSEAGLLALDAASGEERWRFAGGDPAIAPAWESDPPPRRQSAPAVADGTVYVVDSAGSLFAIDAATGELRWQVPVGVPESGPVIGFDDLLYLTVDRETDPTLLAIDRATGAVRWTRPYAGDPTVTEDRLYLADAGELRALDATSGADVWAFPLEGTRFMQPAVSGNQIFVANEQGMVFAVTEAKT